jgi:uncharacterized membrane protein
MPRSSAAHPFLASDIARSLLAMGICVALSFVFALTGLTDRSDAMRVSLYTSWCVLVVAMTVMAFLAYGRADAPTLQRWLVATGPPKNLFRRFWWSSLGGGAIWWAIVGAGITMFTLVNLALQPTTPSGGLIALCVAVVIASYAMIVVSYAVQYGRIDAEDEGFAFPGGTRPRFIDYVYLAAQVSTTFGGSDVALTTSRARRAVMTQSLLAMAFNTVIVSLFVSVLLRAAQPAA